jgi:general secretion pathway protein F
MMLGVSNFRARYGIVWDWHLVGAWFMWRRALQNPALKRRWHTWLLTAPGVRQVRAQPEHGALRQHAGDHHRFRRADPARARTSRDTLSNVAMRSWSRGHRQRARRRQPGAGAVGAETFPPMLVHMIRAGEITGELPAMLERAANSQQADLERRTLTIAGLLEPVLILAMGLVVLLIVLAVLMPIIEINQLVR